MIVPLLPGGGISPSSTGWRVYSLLSNVEMACLKILIQTDTPRSPLHITEFSTLANNPQSLRVLANEWLACSIGRAIGLTIPEPAILYVPSQLVESSPSLVIQLSSSTLKCSHGMAFGSRFISEGEVFDYLPESVLPRISNVEEFAGLSQACDKRAYGKHPVMRRKSG